MIGNTKDFNYVHIGNEIRTIIKYNGRSMKWVVDQMGVPYPTFVGRLNNNKLSAIDLIQLCQILELDFTEFVNSLKVSDELKNEN